MTMIRITEYTNAAEVGEIVDAHEINSMGGARYYGAFNRRGVPQERFGGHGWSASPGSYEIVPVATDTGVARVGDLIRITRYEHAGHEGEEFQVISVDDALERVHYHRFPTSSGRGNWSRHGSYEVFERASASTDSTLSIDENGNARLIREKIDTYRSAPKSAAREVVIEELEWVLTLLV